MADVTLLVDLHSIREATASDVIRIDSILRAVSGDLVFQDDNAASGSPVTLSQLLAGGTGATNFDQLTDTPVDKTGAANKFVAVNAGGTALIYTPMSGVANWVDLTETPDPLVIDRMPFVDAAGTAIVFDDEVRGDNLKTAEPTVSGILGQLDGQLSWVDATDINVLLGSAKLVERVTDKHFRHNLTTWITQNVTVAIAVRQDPYGVVVAEDPGFTGTATIVVVSFATATGAYLRSRVVLGYTVHETSNVIAVINAPDVWKDNAQLTEDLWDIVGIQKVAGTGVHLEIGGGYTSKVTAATLKGRGLNFHTDPDDPQTLAVAASPIPLLFDTVSATGKVFSTGISVFPKTWNNAETETALTGNKAAITQVYELPGRAIAVAQLGTTEYASFAKALENLGVEIATNPLPAIAQRIGFRLSHVIIGNGTAQWVDDGAEIIPVAGGAGGGGVSSGALNVASMEVEHSTVLTAVSTSPVLVVYDVVNDGDINGFFSYAAGVLTCDIACRAVFLPRLDSTVNPGSTRSGIRLDIRHNDVSVQVFDNNSRTDASDAPDTQNNASANLVLAVTDTIKIYINSYVTGLSDVWAGPNRMQLLVMKDLTP